MNTLFFKKNNLLLILIGMIFITTSAMAQPGQREERPMGPPEVPSGEQIQKMVGHLAVDIEMNDQQQEALIGVLTTHFEALKEQRVAHSEELKGLKKELETKAGEVLDDNQLKDFMRFMEKRAPGKKPLPPRGRH